jgi:hypothetical protein
MNFASADLNRANHLDANEIFTVARSGSLSLGANLIKDIERSSKLRAASCRPVMAARLAPQPWVACAEAQGHSGRGIRSARWLSGTGGNGSVGLLTCQGEG